MNNPLPESKKSNPAIRLEMFSDGVLAIIITIMVLELKVPHEASWEALKLLVPVFISYVISFLYVGIYWLNHHHLLHTVKRLSPGIMLANLHLLFWLSLVPFATAWMGENHFAPLTVAVYGAELFMCGFAYFILQKAIEVSHRDDQRLQIVMKKHARKGIFSVIAYLSAIPLAYVNPYISVGIFMVVAIVWLIPEKNFMGEEEK